MIGTKLTDLEEALKKLKARYGDKVFLQKNDVGNLVVYPSEAEDSESVGWLDLFGGEFHEWPTEDDHVVAIG